MKPADAANAPSLVLVENLDHLLLTLGCIARAWGERDITAKIQLLHVGGRLGRRDKLVSNTKSDFAVGTMRKNIEVFNIPHRWQPRLAFLIRNAPWIDVMQLKKLSSGFVRSS